MTDNDQQRGSDDLADARTPIWSVLRWARWRVLFLFLVFASGLTAFVAGVEVSERPGVPAAGVLAQLYYTSGLFVLGGLDIGLPQGGPDWARGLLWFAYFAAPAITTSALVEAVVRVVQPHALRRRLRDHVVVCGCGRLAMLYMRKLRETDPMRPLVVIDRRIDNPYVSAAAANYNAQIIHADMTSMSLLDSLRLDKAHRVMLFSGDDHVNLDTAARIKQLAPNLSGRIVAHVSDLRLLRVIEDQPFLHQIKMFNSYRTAARNLVDTLLVPHFKSTENRDTVVLAGFGRFGQTVLHELQNHASGLFAHVIIVDLKAEILTHVYAEQVGFSDTYDYQSIEADIHEPATWQQVSTRAKGTREETVYVIGSGVDSVNIRSALSVSERSPGSLIIARCFRTSSFTTDISKECHFNVVSTAELLLERFDQNGYFERS